MSEARLHRAGPGLCRLEGRVTMETVPALLAQSDDLFEAVADALEVDCSGIEHADSAAVALMLEWLRRAAAADAEIRFHGLPERVQAIVEVSDLEDVIPVAD